MAKNFSAEEHHICTLFKPGHSFAYDKQSYTVIECGKPTCGAGEPKTDVYVLAADHQQKTREIKISFKKSNANFLENKTNPQRAEQLLGPSWAEIISQATTNMSAAFLSRPLIYKEGHRKTGAGSITLGWKFELLNVDSGQLSGRIPLTRDQIIDVYAGTNLSRDKRDAYVNGRCVPNSGVANFVIFEDRPIRTLQDAANALIPLEAFVDGHPNVYFACKALNYRTFEGKYDGNRPLAVYVNWTVTDGKLNAELRFDRPLTTGGDDASTQLQRSLRALGVQTTDDLHAGNIADPRIVHGRIGTPVGTQRTGTAAPPTAKTSAPPKISPPVPSGGQRTSANTTPKATAGVKTLAPSASPMVSKGTRVFHSTWGVGTVVTVHPGDLIEVRFANYRSKFQCSKAFAQGTLKLQD